MLASLLPGVRRLRTPLATGYLWIVALWMLVHQYVPTKLKDASGPIKSLFQLGTIVGATVALGAATFAAHIIGSLTSFRFGRLEHDYLRALDYERIDHWKLFTIQGALVFRLIHARLFRRLIERAIRPEVAMAAQMRTFADTAMRNVAEQLTVTEVLEALPKEPKATLTPKDINGEETTERFLTGIATDLSAVEIQLQVTNREDVWDRYSQDHAEALFRSAIAPPLALIIFLIAEQSRHYLWLLLLVVPVILLRLSATASIGATSSLIQAIVRKIVVPPQIDRLNEAIHQKKQGLEMPRAANTQPKRR